MIIGLDDTVRRAIFAQPNMCAITEQEEDRKEDA